MKIFSQSLCPLLLCCLCLYFTDKFYVAAADLHNFSQSIQNTQNAKVTASTSFAVIY